MKSRICITFAGPIGSSKTPIAHYLSCELGLPILNNDTIRREIVEDFGSFDQKEYENRRNTRLETLIKSGKSFIYDASVDRVWAALKENLIKNKYRHVLISMDLSYPFLRKLNTAKSYKETLKYLKDNSAEHQKFVKEFGKDISIHISDKNFKKRLAYSLDNVTKLI